MTTGDVSQEQADWIPPGVANPLGATIAHAICGEDAVLQVLLKESRPIYESTWADRTGISEPRWSSELEWARRVKIDLDQVRVYAEAVFAESDAYIAELLEKDLDTVLDLTNVGFGEKTIAWALQS